MAQANGTGIRKSIEGVEYELKGIKHILSAILMNGFTTEDKHETSPDIYTDEFISVEECAKRLSVSEQTIRNWIIKGKRLPEEGWVQGVHYVQISQKHERIIIRIPWNRLVCSFSKNKEVSVKDFAAKKSPRSERKQLFYEPDTSVPDDNLE